MTQGADFIKKNRVSNKSGSQVFNQNTIKNAKGPSRSKDVELPKDTFTKKGTKVTSKMGGNPAKTIIPQLSKRGFKGKVGKRAATGKGLKLLTKAAKKSPLGALALGAAGLYYGSKLFKEKPKDTLTRKDFTKLNKMPGRSSKGISKKDGTEVRRGLFLTKSQEQRKEKENTKRISPNRKVREKNFTDKLRSGDYVTP